MKKTTHFLLFIGIGVLLAALLALFIFNDSFAGAVTAKTKVKEDKMARTPDYESLWKQVQAFTDKGLPKSALEVVEKIYKMAKDNHHEAQMVKALIHKIQFLQEVEESAFVKVQNELTKELKESQFPVTPLLHSMMAEQFWNFYSSNRYRFLNRTATAAEFKEDDIETWDLKKIVEAVMFHYEKSLENPEKSKTTLIEIFDPILYRGESGRQFRPTLYDFLAHRAIDFYMNEEAGLTKPKYEFTLNSPDYFLETGAFSKLELTTKDAGSFRFRALKYLQDLIKFHLNDSSSDALIDVELKRFAFVYQKAVISNKEIIYENVLKQMVEKYSDSPMTAEIYYNLADLYDRLGDQYKPGIAEDYKWHKKKAVELCQTAIATYSHSRGAGMLKSLIARIETKNITITQEKGSSPNKPSMSLIQYRNINKTYLRVIEINRNDVLKFQQVNRDDMIAYLLKKKTVKEWEQSLPDDKDYQGHSAEIKFDGLKWGEYVVLAANTSNFDFKENIVASNFFTISNITYTNRRDDEKGWEFYLTDRETGQPLKKAMAQVWHKVYNNTSRGYEDIRGKMFSADQNGYLNIPYGSVKDNYFFVEFIDGEDHLMADQNYSLYAPYPQQPKTIRTIFFTDRAIYRPGQIVYFKGIMLETDSRDGEKNKILPGQNTVVTLYDVNHQKVGESNLTTNDYGTFNGVFTLPTGVLTGNMQITNGSGYTNLSMEEYKRPKFSVEFKPLEKSVRLNETVEVKGEAKAYAGYAVDNAEVKYRVVREVYYPYPWYWYRYGGYYPANTAPMEITSGVTTTDGVGGFSVKFESDPDLSVSKDTLPAFIFTVYADVTDINGETRSSQKYVKIGYSNLILTNNLPETLDKDNQKQKVAIDSTNLSGDFIKARGELTIYKLKEPDRVFRGRLWAKPDKFIIDKKAYIEDFPNDVYDNEDNYNTWEKEKSVYQSPFDTGEIKEVTLSGLEKWESGKYVMEMKSTDEYGNKIEEIKYFTLFSGTGKHVPYKQLAWFSFPITKVEPGEKAVFLVGTSESNVRAIYEVEYRGKIIETEFLTLNNEQKRIEIPIREEHRGNIGFHLTIVRHNRFLSFNQNIIVPWSNKDLEITFGTFRNKLLPGEKEQWRIKIKGPKGDKVAAEMVAALYDASLDAFRPNYWSFNVFPYNYIRLNWASNSFYNAVSSYLVGKPMKYIGIEEKTYDSLNWFGFYPYWRGYGGGGRLSYGVEGAVAIPPPMPSAAPMRQKMAAAPREEAPGSFNADGVNAVTESKVMADKKDGGKDEEPPASTEPKPEETPIKARTDFKETAFFYPQLQATPEGDVIISFTIPEALTKWKMMGFAHTQNLEYGFIYNELVTQKDLMVVPNPPRFFREADKLVFTSKITNLTENEMTGTAKLQLFDAVTMNPVDTMFKNNELQQPFKAGKGQSALVSWKIEIPDGEDIDAVTYRLTAQAEKFTDGEEQTVPVLKNRMLVTETMPLPVRALQTKTFTFDKLINASKSTTLKHHKLTLEFTSNPVWLAIQALPYLMEFPHECMEQVFSRYYANSMATYIVNSNPKIKRVFDLWMSGSQRKDSPNANALLSNLEKNQELKSLLIQETPWVMNGQNETERKHRIAILFELNTMAAQLESALKKMEDGQMPSGGWPWFKGMFESRYITQHIVCGFAHLNVLKVIDSRKNNRVWNMMSKAVPYLDNEIRKDYEWLIKEKINLKQNNLSYVQVHYLYARSYFQDIPVDDRDKKAFEYYKSQAQKYWADFKDNKYTQGMIALIMNRYKDTNTALSIAKSIKEYALNSEEMGMYWKSSYSYYWWQAPIETQALLIEVFDEVLNDRQSVTDMKTWLLKQKQTQDWRTTKATVDACYALLLKGEDWLKESKEPEITMGIEHPITIEPGKTGPDGELIKTEAGTGYFKMAWNGKEIQPEMGKVTVKNNNNIVAWGGLYWQYFENLDKITPAETPLKLSKKLFIEKTSDTGPVLQPIEDKTPVKIGDRIKVRIEIRVDRNMEYVHMKDMRASSFEPEDVISRYKWQDGLGYYQSTKDASTNFFFDYLPKGTYVFEYALRVTHDGDFSNGVTSIQCMYAPEFTGHSEGVRVKIGN